MVSGCWQQEGVCSEVYLTAVPARGLAEGCGLPGGWAGLREQGLLLDIRLWWYKCCQVFNRPGVARAVLQTPP